MNLISGLLGFFKKIFRGNSNDLFLPSNQIVYRAVRNATWWDGDEPTHHVFLLRDNEKDLSILTKADCKTDGECAEPYCAAIRFKKCFGEVGLKVEGFENLGYQVIHTPQLDDPPIPHHASVLDMPSPNEERARSDALDLLEKVTYKRKRNYRRK